MPDRLAVEYLSKEYDSFLALSPSSFVINPGEIVMLCGPNGSGKTTLLSCMAGLIRSSEGTVKVSGFELYKDEVEVHRRLAFVPDVPRFYLELTAWEHLSFIAMANHALDGFEARAESLLSRLDLWKVRQLFPHHYSRGMRLKLGLALALIRPFEVLLLDEPTSALDQQGIAMLLNELQRLRGEGVSVLLSSHDPQRIAHLADRQMQIRHGVLEEV